MPIAIDASGPPLATTTLTGGAGGLNLTTASFTPPAGSQLWVGAAANQATSGATFTAASTPSLGTFTQAVLTNTQQAHCAWHWANVVTSQAYTVTSTRAGGTTSESGFSCLVVVVTGAETTPGGQTATANSNSGTPTVNITTTRHGSLILAGIGDWSQGGLGTPGTNQTILAEHDLAGQYTSHFWRYNGGPVIGTYQINLTAPTGQDYNLSVVEVRPILKEPPRGRRHGIPAAILNR